MTEFEGYFSSLRGKHTAVAGMGISNLPLVSLLLSYGAEVTVYDRRSPEELGEPALKLASQGVRFVSGEGYLENLQGDIIFRTPGLLPTDPHIAAALAAGIPVTSEMELFYELCPCKKIGITGSDGKTTTSTLIAEMLRAAGKKVWLGGNIGTPLLNRIPDMSAEDVCVTELSSFQLMDMKVSPDVAVTTNLAPNHLDKHGSMEEYCIAKKNIFLHQTSAGVLVANADNAVTAEFPKEAKGEVRLFSRQTAVENGIYCLNRGDLTACIRGEQNKLFPAADIRIPGVHNVENYMAACAAVYDFAAPDAMKQVAVTFPGVEHRLELVRELRGVRYFNSSIDSSPSRTAAALSVFDRKVIVLVGGSDKHISFDGLGELLCQKAKCVILAGATGCKIAEAVRKAPSYAENAPVIIDGHDVANGVKIAAEQAQSGDIVLLSPACASFDAFKNFEERGRLYKRTVLDLN